MEAFFLACFIFGALFTVVSVLLGAAGHLGQMGHLGHATHAGHLPHSHFSPGGRAEVAGHLPHATGLGEGAAHAGQAVHTAPAGHDLQGAHAAHLESSQPAAQVSFLDRVPVLNASSLLAFLTWFGAAGYLLGGYAGWPLLIVLVVAALAGTAAAVLIALFLKKLLAGERVMDPRDYRLQGTLARVTVSIPAAGTGEIVFAKAGARRSEAARAGNGRPILRGTEVVIMEYERGIAKVQPWQELLDENTSDVRSLKSEAE